MQKLPIFTTLIIVSLITVISCTSTDNDMPVSKSTRAVSEINEGTVRQTYIDKPLIGAKGYVVGDWEKGEARVEVMNFPASETGYEAFLFQIDAHA